MVTTEQAIEKIIGQLDHVIETAESDNDIAPEAKTPNEVEILPGFPSKVEGYILFCDTDDLNVSYRSSETLFRSLGSLENSYKRICRLRYSFEGKKLIQEILE